MKRYRVVGTQPISVGAGVFHRGETGVPLTPAEAAFLQRAGAVVVEEEVVPASAARPRTRATAGAADGPDQRTEE